ncbi:MAG TPA: flagellin [Bryobacteraceae bacterium]|nr:flagellin [Bryobacteraceae bacterium]
MIDSLGAGALLFAANLDITQSRINQLNSEITSGLRVSKAGDDPSAVQPILAIQSEIARVTQVQSNLNSVSAETASADSALQSATNMLDSALSVAAQNSSSPASATSMAAGAQQVQQILQQMVNIANTAVNGRYIFGGDATSTAPYAWTAGAATQVSSAPSTRIIEDAAGNQLQPLAAAQDIFGDSFQALGKLASALASGSPDAVQSTIAGLKTAQSTLSGQLVSVGDAQTWLQNASSDAASRLTNLQSSLSALRDTDMPTAITQLTIAQTAEQAAIQAEAQVPRTSLFNYLG